MTIKELKKELKKYSDDCEIFQDSEFQGCPVRIIRVKKDEDFIVLITGEKGI